MRTDEICAVIRRFDKKFKDSTDYDIIYRHGLIRFEVSEMFPFDEKGNTVIEIFKDGLSFYMRGNKDGKCVKFFQKYSISQLMEKNNVLDIPAVLDRYSISRGKLTQLKKYHGFPESVRYGRKFYFRLSDLEKWERTLAK